MGTLRTKMEKDLAVRGISARTGQNYLRFVDLPAGAAPYL